MKKLLSRLKNQKGFSMLENILATTILGVGLMGGMLTMQNSLANTVNGDMNTVAIQKANEKVELILADRTFRSYDYVTADNYDTEVMQDSYNMSRYVTVTEVSADDLTTPESDSGLKKVVVTVSWGDEASQQVAVTTLVSNYE